MESTAACCAREPGSASSSSKMIAGSSRHAYSESCGPKPSSAWSACRGDAGEVLVRCRGGAREVQVRCKGETGVERLQRGHAQRGAVAFDNGDQHRHERGHVARQRVAEEERHLLEQRKHLQQR